MTRTMLLCLSAAALLAAVSVAAGVAHIAKKQATMPEITMRRRGGKI